MRMGYEDAFDIGPACTIVRCEHMIRFVYEFKQMMVPTMDAHGKQRHLNCLSQSFLSMLGMAGCDSK